MNIGIWSLIGVVGGILVSIWAILKYIITKNYKVDDSLSKNLITKLKKCKWKFELNDEFSINKKYPSSYKTIVWIDGALIFFNREERLLQAGWQSKDTVAYVYFLRWQKNKVESLINEVSNCKQYINVMALTPGGSDKVGELSSSEIPQISIDEYLYKDIEQDVAAVVNGEKNKTSCLLYGVPGTGKTRLIKYFSQKYKLPIYSVYLNPDYNNLDILLMFSTIPDKCIVLFEDFDNYFNKRECIMKSEYVKFTFDSILSVLDGVYNDYKGVVFAMTCNNISKIDDSISNRPSRMKWVREITPPSFKKRLELLEDYKLAELTEGFTIDKVFFVQSLIGKYSTDRIMEVVKTNIEEVKQTI